MAARRATRWWQEAERNGAIEAGVQDRGRAATAGGLGSARRRGAGGRGKADSVAEYRAGQLLSPQNLAGDRDTLLTDYMSRGFDQVKVDVTQRSRRRTQARWMWFFTSRRAADFCTQGADHRLALYAAGDGGEGDHTACGDPLNETALADTQRNLYDLALFNEVNTASENPNGGETDKTVLLQLQEARRWC